MFTSSRKFHLFTLLVICVAIAVVAVKKDDDENEKPAWAKKKITDYSDADMERLLDQWNVRNHFPLYENCFSLYEFH